MRFVRKKPISTNYAFDGYELELVDNFLDLGVLLDSKINFIPHITMTANKARSTLSFIKREAKEFNDPCVTKSLFTSFVRPILAYGSIIWNAIHKKYSNVTESVQKQFLMFYILGLNINLTNLQS